MTEISLTTTPSEPSVSDGSTANVDPLWVRPSLLALLVGTGLLYIVDLGKSGWANSFYSAAVQAGTVSWKAFFFGSSDAGNSITVDKPPASLWVMEISTRIFGVNSWSILIPEALLGIASVALLYVAIRRWFSPAAGLIAGLVLALTPVSTLMFRFNNPDALLVFLLIAAAYATMRALENGSGKWLAFAGLVIGFAFITKMLQAFLIVPTLALAYLVCAPIALWPRVKHVLYAGVGILVGGGWWVTAVTFWPKTDRPYVGGSQTNSVLDLVFGYNGLGRLSGNETGSVGGGGMSARRIDNPFLQYPSFTTMQSRWGSTGIFRLFSQDMGGQISWLLPSSLLFLIAGFWVTRKAIRTDRTRAALIVWGGWLVVSGLVLSFGQGIIHPYYTVALAPAVGALVGIGVHQSWQHRHQVGPVILGSATALAAVWSFALLQRESTWLPWLRWVVLVGGLAIAIALFFLNWAPRRPAIIAGIVALCFGLAAPTAFSLVTASKAETGAIPTAGPNNNPFSRLMQGDRGRQLAESLGLGNGRQAGGNLLNAGKPNAAVLSALTVNADKYVWIAATVSSNSAAGYQLASGRAVMPIGGFNGTDPSPTLVQFKEYVNASKIHYFIGTSANSLFGGGSSGPAAEITAWVKESFSATAISGVTLYDLTQPK